jgi:Xaa-Pro aminopeptidase
MRYKQIDPKLFIENRARFIQKMEPNSIAIFTSNDIMPNNADDMMGFTQNNDLFYLSGIDQEETVLILYPDAALPENREILFVLETSELLKIWEGDKLTKQQAYQISGIKNVKWVSDFELALQYMAFEADTFYLGHNEHKKTLTADMNTKQDRMIAYCKEKYPLHNYKRAAVLTRELRQIKSEIEVNLIKKAASISAACFSRVLKTVKPGIMEYELEAELTYELVKQGAKRHAFLPIIASGANACALHYNTNNEVCKNGDMVLMDFGVCYANYNSDTTRCFPVNGKFTSRQKEVYNAVLTCLKKGSQLIQVGVLPADYEKKMALLVEEQLINLGLFSKDDVAKQDENNPLYKKYFMHGTAHHIGLDVHDVGLYSRPFEAGMVVTCEPGIYIAEEGIGCRLENDYLITQNGPVNLTEALPIEINEIEKLINS